MTNILTSLSKDGSVARLHEKNPSAEEELSSRFLDDETEAQCQKSFERLLAITVPRQA